MKVQAVREHSTLKNEPDSVPMLELEGIVKHYGRGDTATQVLCGVDLTVDRGDTVAITGPSGCGKSTLLNIIGTLDSPDQGRVRIEGRHLTDLGPAQLAALRNQQIGFVFQAHHLLPQCTVLENVLIPTVVNSARTSDSVARARELLADVGLADRLTHLPGQLSGGECQRTALVRALINRPALLLADEPTGSVDRQASETLADLLAAMNRKHGLTIVLVTHAPHIARRMRRVLVLQNGQLQDAKE